MRCRLADLRCKEVINIHDGFRLGFVGDAIINTATGQLLAIVVPGPFKFFGLLGREDDYIIPWESIRKMGDDIILVDAEGKYFREKRKRPPSWKAGGR